MSRIVSDSSCDIHELEGADFISVPMHIYTDERSFLDDADLDVKEMTDYLAAYKGRSYSSCPNIEAWLKAFEGAEEIFAVALTSGLSGAYNAAMNAKEMYLQEHPLAKVHVFDTLTTGPEQCLLVEKLAELKAKGLSFEEICEQGTEYLKHTQLLYMMKSVHNFVMNGRINKVIGAAIGAFNIRIICSVSPSGTVEPISKVRGDKKTVADLVKQLKSFGFTSGKINMTHVLNPELAEEIKAAVLKEFPKAQIKIYPSGGLCSYYAEPGGILMGVEL